MKWEIKAKPSDVMNVIYGGYNDGDIEEDYDKPYEFIQEVLDQHIADMEELQYFLEEKDLPIDIYQLGDVINILQNIKFVKGGK